jgi:hypothetical protein
LDLELGRKTAICQASPANIAHLPDKSCQHCALQGICAWRMAQHSRCLVVHKARHIADVCCRWAQELAGVDVIPSLPASWTGLDKDQLLAGLSAYRSQLRLETLLERLAVAKQGQLALK